MAILKIAGGQIEPGGVQPGTVANQGQQVMRPAGFQLMVFQNGSRSEHPGQGARHQFALLGRFRLVTNGNLAAGIEELFDVARRGVVRDAGHGVAVALREGQAEQARAPWVASSKNSS